MIIRIVCIQNPIEKSWSSLCCSLTSLIAIGIGYAPYRLRLIVLSRLYFFHTHSQPHIQFNTKLQSVSQCLPFQLYFNLTLFNILVLLMIYSRISNQFFSLLHSWRRFSMCDHNRELDARCSILHWKSVLHMFQWLTNLYYNFFLLRQVRSSMKKKTCQLINDRVSYYHQSNEYE